MTRWWTPVVLAASSAVLAAGLAVVPLVRTVELKTYDLRMRAVASEADAGNVLLVDIDEASIRRLEPLVGRWPWPRLVHAQVVNFLARGKPGAVLYDILFTEHDRRTFTVGAETWSGAESDGALAEAVGRAGNVVLMADAVAEPVAGEAPAPTLASVPSLPRFSLAVVPEQRPVVVLPFEELARAGRVIGHSFTVLDADGPLRRTVPFVRGADRDLVAGPIAALMIARGMAPEAVRLTASALEVGPFRAPVIVDAVPRSDGSRDTGYRTLVRFDGTHRRFSFYDLFYAEQQVRAGERPVVDPAVFANRIVVVGTTTPGLADTFAVPVGGKISGSEVHAMVIDSLSGGRFLRPTPWWGSATAYLACALLVSLVALRFGPWAASGSAAAAAAALWAVSVSLFARGEWLPLVGPAAALALATFGGTAYHYFVEGREKRRVKQLFGRFVSQDVFERLLEDPGRAALGGERRDMSVLFSDIRGFTTLSESADAHAIVGALNEYFTRMVPVVLAHRGTVDKFVGDMIMALFGAPVADAEHADHAVETALAMSRALDTLNAERTGRGEAPLEIGIGINSGDMVAGLIGSERILSYTVIGDAVNLGSRLESLNKEYGTRIIISDETRLRLRREYQLRPLGEVRVKGRMQPVAVFEVRAAVPGGEAGRAGERTGV